MKIKPIILSGGSGKRLWPLSTDNMPKQFFDIFDNKTNLFEQTLKRVCSSKFEKPIIISNKSQRFNILSSIDNTGIKYDTIVLEDTPKNTAPAFAASTFLCSDDQILCFLPSDHYIKNQKKFIKTLCDASKIASKDNLVILGIKSKGANENYGYITYNRDKPNNKLFTVNSFIEKPNKTEALKLYKKKALWNSGIVIIKNKYLKDLLNQHSKKLFNMVRNSFENSHKNMEFLYLNKKYWNKIIPISFDYAILEKKFKKIVLPLDVTWSDLGTYESIYKIKDTIGNVEKISTKNCFAFSNNKLLIIKDVEDLNIVNTKNFTLVTKKGKSKEIKKLIDKISKKRKKEFFLESDSNRPWGSFSNLGDGNGYKVKKLVVKPGQKISLQKHFKRSEHWVVVEGTATIIKGKQEFKLNVNQSTFIKKGQIHRIENKTKKDLIMIEVQIGNYLEEDDIMRYEDIYIR